MFALSHAHNCCFRRLLKLRYFTFCVIADVPYVEEEALALPKQIQNETEGCEFLVHLGDIMPGDQSCSVENFDKGHTILKGAKIPTFIVVGDNEWNDCGIVQKFGVLGTGGEKFYEL